MKNPVVVFGLSGSGKSFIADILYRDFGYEWLRSDAIRKEMMGIAPEESASADFGKGIYTEDITKKVYKRMLDRAQELIKKGKRVVLDATFLRSYQRKMALERFPDALFLLIDAPEEEIRRRLNRRKDISDADYSIYLKQKEVFEPPKEVDFIRIDNTKSRTELRKLLESVLRG